MIKTKGSPSQYIAFLKLNKKDFQVRKTTGTTIVTNYAGVKRLYYKDDMLAQEDFGFMNRLRSHIKSSAAYRTLKNTMDEQYQDDSKTKENLMLHRSKMDILIEFGISPRAVRYFEFDASINDVELELGCCYEYENIKECDITKAYYYAAYRLGVVTRTLFDECLNLPREKRLKMMGSIATTVTIDTYIGGKLKHSDITNDKYLRAIWFSICRYVDACMLDIKNFLVKDFLFYWVDGIFYRDSSNGLAQKTIDSIMKAYGFDYTLIDIPRVYIENRDGEIMLCVEKPNGDKPTYNIPKNKVRGYYLGNPVEGYTVNDEKIYV